ncbi:uncharacterized protein AB675_3263 [Cyphellophora attinorum]|uniref:Uncharacterized protein n=1 Tax=Cyphellophora attinorum TaxID=1664694 RepID=A0A0N1H8X3_9EURO|nr:uncharacterized protein AB675_3263 [Phialophora attinorum]KPI39763.1 hypothetical protein AB675_3263 [Phialophora attinorum]
MPSPWKKAVKLDISDNERTVKTEYHCAVRDQNQAFLKKTIQEIAYEYDCDVVRVRADIHNTRSVRKPLAAAAPSPALIQNKRSGNTIAPLLQSKRSPNANVPLVQNKRAAGTQAGPSLGKRTIMVQTYEPAPWHATLEFRQMENQKWFTAHVYAETQTWKIGNNLVEGIATGEMSKPDGKDIPENPEIFPEQFSSSAKGFKGSTDQVKVAKK